MHPLLIIIVVVILMVGGQMLFKAGVKRLAMKEINFFTVARNFLPVMFRPFIFFGFVLFGLSFLLWLVVLSRYELSYAVPLLSMSYIAVLFLSSIFFKEKVSGLRWLGAIVICAGVWLITLS